MVYSIYIDRQAKKALSAVPKKLQRQIAKKIDALANNPFPDNARLIQTTMDIYRIRSGDYRIAYKVKRKRLLILVISIGHRRDFYQKLL